MSAIKYLAPALAIAARAAAADSCSAATTTIQNAGDASALASCTTFSGSIAIATGTVDNIALDGVQEITGSLSADNVTMMTTLSGADLEKIGDSFALNGVQVLSTLNFPRLTNVDTIDWQALPNLQGLSFTTGVQMASSVSIQNTGLASLDGINLQVVDSMIIENNPFLEDLEMQLGNISTALSIGANGQNVSAIFPNLEWAFNMTFRNVSNISLPSLAAVNGSLGFYSNFMDSVACPNLTNIGGSLSFISNADLTNITMPELKQVQGALNIQNNTALEEITGFGSLTTVTGAVDFYGNFSDVELPALKDVRGAFNLQSSSEITEACDHFQSIAGPNLAIKGTYTCKGKESNPGTTGTLPGGTSDGGSGGSSSSTPSSAASAMQITGATGFLGVVAAIFGML